jgi:hypothetical protein
MIQLSRATCDAGTEPDIDNAPSPCCPRYGGHRLVDLPTGRIEDHAIVAHSCSHREFFLDEVAPHQGRVALERIATSA